MELALRPDFRLVDVAAAQREFKHCHPDKLGLIINVPPSTSKTSQITVAWSVWDWLKNPSRRFLCGSYSARLSTDHSAKRRFLITSTWFQERWGERFTLSPIGTASTITATIRQGAMWPHPWMAARTGFGGDICIGDDLLSAVEGFSEEPHATPVIAGLTRLSVPA